MSKPHYLSPRRRMRVLGRDPLPTGVDTAVEESVVTELQTVESPDPMAVHELVRVELQRILLERQDVLERLALGARSAQSEVTETSCPIDRRRRVVELRAVPNDAEARPSTEAEPELQTEASARELADVRLAQMHLEIERYKRRITKLCGSLERAESALQQVAENGTGISGLPSVFRTVQGLSRDDDNFLIKHDALSKIFEANLALRKHGSPSVA